ncbi:MAG: hypothetical protein ABI432_16965 [Flavobacteriales bacterium]
MRSILLLSVTFFVCKVNAQSDTVWVLYHGGMDLRDGLYMDFQAFRTNTPSVPIERLREKQGLPVNDIRSVLSNLYWQPDSGERQTLNTTKLWGFCQNDVIYVAAGDGFFRIGLMGSLAHLVFEKSYRDWDPYMDPYGGGVTRTAMTQQLVDMETGAFLPFNASGMDQAFQHDAVLLEEFRAFPKKQRNSDEALFRFLRIYNERHPLLFPEISGR